MKTIWIRSDHTALNQDDWLRLEAGFKHWLAGFRLHPWGIRLMLIWGHCCIRFGGDRV